MEQYSHGLVFNVQRFSLHDGPGIRTTVFFKGCPLKCDWCSNPEGILPAPELRASDKKCSRCYACVEICNRGAIAVKNGARIIERAKCDVCFECVDACQYGALSIVGKMYGVDELMREIERDAIFYMNSGGGVTFSGGEPLLQSVFIRRVFEECQRKGIHTTLDTTGCCLWPELNDVLEVTDLVLYDIKHLDKDAHEKNTGVDNTLILENFEKIVIKIPTWVRVPLIQGFNDSVEFAESLRAYLLEIDHEMLQQVSLLPQHSWGFHKYPEIGRECRFDHDTAIEETRIQAIKEILRDLPVEVCVGI